MLWFLTDTKIDSPVWYTIKRGDYIYLIEIYYSWADFFENFN